MDESKRALRMAAVSRRNSLPPTDCLTWSRSIQARVLDSSLYRNSRAIALYSAVQNEVNTDHIRDNALRVGKGVFYPRLSQNDGGEFVLIKSIGEMIPGRFGVPEPSGRERLEGRLDGGLLVFVPGVSFDREGNRLGRGKGWYDLMLRRIAGSAIAVGLAYEFQIVNRVPADPWDQRVQYIFTEDRFIECEKM